MDRVSIIANEEVCKRCHLYTKHCGMLEYPSQCVDSGHFIDGYRKGEKDTKDALLELAKDMKEANDGVCDTSYYQEFIDKINSM